MEEQIRRLKTDGLFVMSLKFSDENNIKNSGSWNKESHSLGLYVLDYTIWN